MPPCTASSAATSKRTGGRKKKSAEEIVDSDSDLPLVISASVTSNKRKTRKSEADAATVVKPDPSPDASPLPKKMRAHSPIPALKTTEDEDEAVEDDDSSRASRPRRSRTAAAKATSNKLDGLKDASSRSKNKSSQASNLKALGSPRSDGEQSDDGITMSFKAGLVTKNVGKGDPLTIDSNDSDVESFPATPTKKRGPMAKTTKASTAINSDSDVAPMTPKKTHGQIAKGKGKKYVGSDHEDEPLGDDQWPATPKASIKPVSSVLKGKDQRNDLDESDLPTDNDKLTQLALNKGKKPLNRSTQVKTPSQLLYPAEFDLPADSDYDNQDQDAFEPADMQLMPLLLQDPKLRYDYTRLPDMPFIEMQPFQRYGEHTAERYSLVWAALKDEGDELVRRRFRRAIKFKNCLPYMNPARVQKFLVKRDADRLVLANAQGRKYPAVLLTTGVVSHCHLVTAAKSMTGTYNVKRIGIYPFHVEHQRAMAMIGGGLGTQNIAGPMYDGSLVFQTRREMDGNNDGILSSPGFAASGTPSRSGRTPIKFQKPTSTVYPTSLSFNDKVPIYDLRRNRDFMFTDEDLNNLSSLPLYKGGAKDLPPDSVVTVGYSVGTYPYKGSNPALAGGEYTALSLNVLFVILLGLVDRKKLNKLAECME
ncbi:hypothetical protein F5887DRAFT_1084051 [Amanita rubescens]|nr:hypothetical protein F5887DRAFT_1084051 [Amanita rubescens]